MRANRRDRQFSWTVLLIRVASQKSFAQRISGILKLIEERAKPHEHVEFSDPSSQTNLAPHVWVGATVDWRPRVGAGL